MSQNIVTLAFIFLFAVSVNSVQQSSKGFLQQRQAFASDEELLYKVLFVDSNYNKKIPPIKNETHRRIELDLEVELMGVMKVDSDDGTVTFKAALRQWWYDPRIIWDPANFSNVEKLLIEPDDLWHPDTVVREDAGSEYLSNFKMTPIRIYPNGMNYWTRLGELTVAASLDFSSYPYDSQTIYATVGSWMYTDERMHYNLRKSTGGFVIQNATNWILTSPQWHIQRNECSVQEVVLVHAWGVGKFQKYKIQIQREGGTMLVGLIIPAILVAFLGSPYILLPRGSGERVSYLATILLTEIMFSVMITQVVPEAKIVPTIAILFLELTVMLILITITVLIIDKIQVVLNKKMEAFNQKEQENKDLFSVNEERQSLIEEATQTTMVIKGSSISGREKIIQMEARINMADKIVFYTNIALFAWLTTRCLHEIVH